MSYTIVNGVLTSTSSGIVNAIIPEGVTAIGSNAFVSSRFTLQTVQLPSTLTIINESVFSDCANLTTVSGSPSITTIGPSAFYFCTKLTSIPSLSSLTSLGTIAFMFCTKLLSIPGFGNSSITTIQNNTFQNCGITSITLPSTLTSIGVGTFMSCPNLASISIPTGVTAIPRACFIRCPILESVTLPTSLQSIGIDAFSSCRMLSTITIPSSVTSIGERAFHNCADTTNIYFEGNAPTLIGINVNDPTNPFASVRTMNLYYKTTTTGWTTPWTEPNTNLIVWIIEQSNVPCFLGYAPVLTPNGYKRIDALAIGDNVLTDAGKAVPIQRIAVKSVVAGPAVNPYILKKGMYGATRDIEISPNHRVKTGRGMIEARHLGLEQKQREGEFTYYNVELPHEENMVVAGVTVESLAHVRRITIPLADFKRMLTKSGRQYSMEQLMSTCKLYSNGYINCPVTIKK